MVKVIANRIFLDPEKNIYWIKLSKGIHDYKELLENLKEYAELFYVLLDEENNYYIVKLIPKDESLKEEEIEEFLWLLSPSSIKGDLPST